MLVSSSIRVYFLVCLVFLRFKRVRLSLFFFFFLIFTGLPNPVGICVSFLRFIFIRVMKSALKLTADQKRVFDWIASSIQVNSPININEASFFARFLWLDAAIRQYYVNYSSYIVNAFRVHVESGLENVFFCIFRWF